MAATETYTPRLKERYNDELRAAAAGASWSSSSIMQVADASRRSR